MSSVEGSAVQTDSTAKDKFVASYQPAPYGQPTIEELFLLWRGTIIGTIEFRNWLAQLYPSFAASRRADVDQMMEDEADRLLEEQEKQREFDETQLEEEDV